jgi:hypothetical protein
MYQFPWKYRILGLLTLIILMSGCSWTPRVETSIYEDSQVSVSLITVPEESFAADHPVAFQTDTITHILNGLQLRQHKRLLQKIFSSDNAAQPVFTEEQTNVLATQLQQGFSQVTPEEHVAFQTQGNPARDIQAIKGTMYVKSENLYVSLTFSAPGAHAATKTAGRAVRPDQEGSGKPAVVFNPKEALQGEQTPHWLFGGEDKNHIVINLPTFASLKKHQDSPPAIPTDTPKTVIPREAAPKKGETVIPKNIENSSEHKAGDSDTQMLLEEIKALRKELADQKQAIEEIKQEKPETR